MIEIIIILSVAAAGICNAVMDKLQFHFSTSIFAQKNPNFWNPSESWSNKWKDGNKANGERFLGSSTVFVAFTDAWHLFQFLQNTFIMGVIALLVAAAVGLNWVGGLVAFVIVRVVYSVTFELFFAKIFSKKS